MGGRQRTTIFMIKETVKREESTQQKQKEEKPKKGKEKE